MENIKAFLFYFMAFSILFWVYVISSNADDKNKKDGLNITPIERIYMDLGAKQ